MKFIDEAVISIKAGHGGAGSLHFHRAKFIPKGGPDGGDGGEGGSVYFRADESQHTLLDFRYKRNYEAEDGERGGVNLRTGHGGQDLIIPVPVGTQICDAQSGEMICDLNKKNVQYCLAKGGQGGKGNAFFKNSIRQAPKIAQPGGEGVEREVKLVLKSIADVGLVGFPNAGKSSLVRKVSNAKPIVADYPFTTLTPQLGIVKGRNRSFVMADIPGLIEGAASGIGLGIKFLKHIERVSVLVYVLDAFTPFAGDHQMPDALQQFLVLQKELTAYSPLLLKKPALIFLNKLDLLPYSDLEVSKLKVTDLKKLLEPKQYKVITQIIKLAEEQNLPLFMGSALAGLNLVKLLDACEAGFASPQQAPTIAPKAPAAAKNSLESEPASSPKVSSKKRSIPKEDDEDWE